MLSLTAQELVALVSAWMWPFFRIASMLMVAPVFGASYVAARVRLGLAVVVTLVVAPLVPGPPPVEPLSAEGFLITGQQVLVGVTMGFALRLILAVFELVGQIIAQHMALHFASLVDPNSGVQMPMLAQFYMILALLVFLSLNGHLVALQVLAESFTVVPVAVDGIGREGFWHLALQMGWVFSSALAFALPAIAALLVVNLAFGVVTRAAPQLNIFSVGFPAIMIMGFGIIYITLPHFVVQFEPLFHEALSFTRALLTGVP